MAAKANRAVEIQRKYYTDTAARYDSMHAHEGASDASLTSFLHAFLRMLQAYRPRRWHRYGSRHVRFKACLAPFICLRRRTGQRSCPTGC